MTQRQEGPAPQTEGLGGRISRRKTGRSRKDGSANAADDKIPSGWGACPGGTSETGAVAAGDAPAPTLDPARLTAGSNSQSGVDEVGIHWLNVTAKGGSLEQWEKAVRLALSKVDPGEPRSRNGRYWFKFREEWPSGVSLLWGHPDGTFMLEVNGGACDLLGFNAVRSLADAALIGATCTRLDICRDLKTAPGEPPLPLIGKMLEACERGELCRVRTYMPIAARDTGNPQPKGETLELGGRESPARLVVYDKGLEQGTHERGEWVRLEARLSDHHANLAAFNVFTAGTAWPKVAAERIMGVIDFRELTGDPNIERRARLPWWEALCRHLQTVRAAIPDRSADLDRWLEHAHNAIGRTLVDVAHSTGLSTEELWLLVCRQLEGCRQSPRKFPPRIVKVISDAVVNQWSTTAATS